MAYPEPIPVIRDEDAREFLDRLRNFKLTAAQLALFKEGFEAFSRSEGEK